MEVSDWVHSSTVDTMIQLRLTSAVIGSYIGRIMLVLVIIIEADINVLIPREPLMYTPHTIPSARVINNMCTLNILFVVRFIPLVIACPLLLRVAINLPRWSLNPEIV